MTVSLETILPLLVMGIGTALLPRWVARTRHLRLTIFQPYRGDPWPIGVQEDDDIRFDWTRPAPEEPLDRVAVEPVGRADVRHPRR
jgi:hypothetical protein